MRLTTNSFLLFGPFALGLAVASCSAGPTPGMSDTGPAPGVDAPPFDAGPCTGDSDCPGSYCNMGSFLCCVPADPPYELCGDRIDQNCDRRDESCGDNDADGIQACAGGEDPLGGCDCNDEDSTVRPRRGSVPSAPEICDALDNDCNGRIDESALCCGGCASLGADRNRADVCTVEGVCDCSGDAASGPCAVGLVCCSVGCVDITSDVMNCGFCDAPCTVGADRCVASVCMCGDGPVCDFTGECTAGACAMM